MKYIINALFIFLIASPAFATQDNTCYLNWTGSSASKTCSLDSAVWDTDEVGVVCRIIANCHYWSPTEGNQYHWNDIDVFANVVHTLINSNGKLMPTTLFEEGVVSRDEAHENKELKDQSITE